MYIMININIQKDIIKSAAQMTSA